MICTTNVVIKSLYILKCASSLLEVQESMLWSNIFCKFLCSTMGLLMYLNCWILSHADMCTCPIQSGNSRVLCRSVHIWAYYHTPRTVLTPAEQRIARDIKKLAKQTLKLQDYGASFLVLCPPSVIT